MEGGLCVALDLCCHSDEKVSVVHSEGLLDCICPAGPSCIRCKVTVGSLGNNVHPTPGRRR